MTAAAAAAAAEKREEQLAQEVAELRREKELASGENAKVMELARDVRHLQVDLDAEQRRSAALEEEKESVRQAALQLQAQLRQAHALLEERHQQVRHLQIDLHAAQFQKPEPVISVQGSVVAQAHTQLQEAQKMVAEAEARANDSEAKAATLLRDLEAERLELTRTRKSLKSLKSASLNGSLSRSQPSLRMSDPLGPYAASQNPVVDQLERRRKPGTGRLPSLTQRKGLSTSTSEFRSTATR